MSWIAIIVDLNNNKVKIDWFNLKKIVIGTIRGDQFLFIIPIQFLLLQCFSLEFSIPFSQGFPSILHYLPPFISTLHV